MKRLFKFLLLGILLLVLSACSDYVNAPSDQLAAIDPNFRFPVPTTGPLNHDEQFAKIARTHPEFAGYYYDNNGILTAGVKSSDTSKLQSLSITTSSLAKTIANVAGEEALFSVLSADNTDLSTGREKSSSPVTSVERQLKVVSADYSFNELASARDVAETNDIFAIPGVVSVDLDEYKNRLVFGVDSSKSAKQVEVKLSRLGLSALSVVNVVPPVVTHATVDSYLRPIRGGIATSTDVAAYPLGCTLGFPAVRNGVPGFVTNSHCTGKLGTYGNVFRQPNPSSPIIGRETADAPTYLCADGVTICRASDSAFVSIANTGTTTQLGKIASLSMHWNVNATITGSYSIVGTGTPARGQQMFKVGQTTGSTWGTVDQTCIHINLNYEFQGKVTNLCSYTVIRPVGVAQSISAPGDSGSPVFSIVSGSSVRLQGSLYGGQGYGIFLFSPYTSIVKSLGYLQVF